jgi:hypothetical protein
MSDSTKIQEVSQKIGGMFPGGFDFYELGRVVPAQDPAVGIEDLHDGKMGVAFSVYPMDEATSEIAGLRTLMLAIFEEGLEHEIYAEIGNVIASRFAGGLSKLISEEVMITPPLTLKPAAVQRLIHMKRQTLTHKRYLHSYQNKLIPIDVLVLRVEEKNQGNA